MAIYNAHGTQARPLEEFCRQRAASRRQPHAIKLLFECRRRRVGPDVALRYVRDELAFWALFASAAAMPWLIARVMAWVNQFN